MFHVSFCTHLALFRSALSWAPGSSAAGQLQLAAPEVVSIWIASGGTSDGSVMAIKVYGDPISFNVGTVLVTLYEKNVTDFENVVVDFMVAEQRQKPYLAKQVSTSCKVLSFPDELGTDEAQNTNSSSFAQPPLRAKSYVRDGTEIFFFFILASKCSPLGKFRA